MGRERASRLNPAPYEMVDMKLFLCPKQLYLTVARYENKNQMFIILAVASNERTVQKVSGFHLYLTATE